jgi:hypothetical protein
MNLSPLPKLAFLDNNGRPLVGGLLFTYAAGTTTKLATYTDEGGLSQNTNPIVLDFRGEANVWLDPELTYKLVLAPPTDTDPPANPIWSVDDVEAPIGLSIITRQFIGRLLYPRTAAEIDAGVTPVDYGYPERNVLRYGADNEGVNPSLDGILDAIRVARSRRALYGLTTVEVYFPDGVYLCSDGVPIVTGVVYRCDARWSAACLVSGTGVSAYTATYGGGSFSDNLDATITQIQDGTRSVENCSIVNMFFEKVTAVTGNAPSGAAWEAGVQIVGAPSILIDSIYASTETNNIHGLSLKFCWRAKVLEIWVPRGNAFTGGSGLRIEDETNSSYVEAPFAFGPWDYGVDAGSNSVTIVEPNCEFCDVGARLFGTATRLMGGYYEGNNIEIQLGIVGSPVNRALVMVPWLNGAGGAQYGIDILAATNSRIVTPFFTGSYAVSQFKTTAASTENYANVIEHYAANADSPNLAGVGLIGGRNFIRIYGEDNDDQRFYQEYRSSDGAQIELQLNQRGAANCMFEVKLINNAGTLQVVIGNGDEATNVYTTCFVNSSATPTTLPDVSAGAGFGSVGAGRLAAATSIIVLNTNENVANEQDYIAGCVRNNTGAALAVEFRPASRDIGGTTRVRPEFRIRNAATDAAVDFTTANFTNGQYIKVPILGFIK